MRFATCFIATSLLLGGCARVNDMGLRMVSTSADAYAIVNGQLLNGSVTLIPDRTGRFSLAADQGPVTSCSGAMRNTASNAGTMDLHCNDGTDMQLHFALITETRGYAYGRDEKTSASLAFGLPPQDAIAYLRAPEGKKLSAGADGNLQLQ